MAVQVNPSTTAVDVAVRRLRKIAVFVLGVTVVLIGIAMIVLPGPAFVVIPAGLGILAIEFFWAKRWLVRLRRSARNVAGRAQRARRAHADAREQRRPPVRAAIRAAIQAESPSFSPTPAE